MEFRELKRSISRDFEFLRGDSRGIKSYIITIFFNPKFQILFNYRLSVYLEQSPFGFFNIITKYINLIVFSSEISPNAIIGENIKIPHPIGLVIGHDVKIGDNVTIYQNVTIGGKNIGEGKYPTIGNSVVIFANTTIVGDIVISDNITIGANSLVLSSCPAVGAVYAGNPAKKIQKDCR